MDHKSDRLYHRQKSSGRFFDGLLVGLILGFGLALLITTKKGRKMLRTLTDEGLDSVSELKKRLDNIEISLDEEDETDEEYIVEEADEEIEEQDVPANVAPVGKPQASSKSPKKRLFKGIAPKN